MRIIPDSTSTAQGIDVAQVLFDKLDSTNQLPDHAEAFSAAMSEVAKVIGYEKHEELWDAAMQMLCAAKEDAFRAAWALRGGI